MPVKHPNNSNRMHRADNERFGELRGDVSVGAKFDVKSFASKLLPGDVYWTTTTRLFMARSVTTNARRRSYRFLANGPLHLILADGARDLELAAPGCVRACVYLFSFSSSIHHPRHVIGPQTPSVQVVRNVDPTSDLNIPA